MRKSRARRLIRLALVASRELVAAATDAFEAISAEMDAYDAGVDTTSVRAEDLPRSRGAAQSRRDVDQGGPYGRQGPMDDEPPVYM